jgi:shikimate kinase
MSARESSDGRFAHAREMFKEPTRRRIVITGFMCAGKTTVAAALAGLLRCASADLDSLVTEREGRTPRRLIDEEGEEAFRQAETRALIEVLEKGEARIIALGGGTYAFAHNRASISRHNCLTVWLDAPFELCWQRLKGATEQEERPLARDRKQALRLYEERRAAYEQAALRVGVTEELSAARIAQEIETWLQDIGAVG